MTFSLRVYLFIFTAVVSLFSGSATTECDAKMNRGSPCSSGGKAHIAWFYDAETDVCLAFKFSGCGGNANRFDTIDACQQRCMPPDRGMCALNKEPSKNSAGMNIICSGPEKHKCPPGYQCKHLAFMGVCCPTKFEELFSKNYQGACSVGQTVKMDRGEWKETLLGKSCADGFCPDGSICEQGEIFAHCCHQ